MVAVINLDDDLEEQLERYEPVTRARIEHARRISEDARDRTIRGRSGRAANSHRVEVDESTDPPSVAAVGGGGDAWYYLFQEFGGSGFRPPPTPLRAAAKGGGATYVDDGR